MPNMLSLKDSLLRFHFTIFAFWAGISATKVAGFVKIAIPSATHLRRSWVGKRLVNDLALPRIIVEAVDRSDGTFAHQSGSII